MKHGRKNQTQNDKEIHFVFLQNILNFVSKTLIFVFQIFSFNLIVYNCLINIFSDGQDNWWVIRLNKSKVIRWCKQKWDKMV